MLDEKPAVREEHRAPKGKLEAFARLGLLDKKVEHGEPTSEVMVSWVFPVD